MGGERESRPVFVLLILLTGGVFVSMLIFNFLAGNPSQSGGLFINGIGNVSEKYVLQITPAGWTFAIWGLIYLLQAGWLVYSIANLCRRVEGGLAYMSPIILSPMFFIMFMVNNVSNIVWLFLWDREYIMQAAPLLCLTAMTCCFMLLISYCRLEGVREELEEEGRGWEITVFRLFVFNGLGMYGAWTTIATALNIGSVAAYVMTPPVSQSNTSLFCLAVITAAYLIFVVLDLTLLERFSRFTLSPYLTLLWALAGVLSKNWNPEQTASIVSAVLVGLGVVGVVLKVVVSFWRQKQQPVSYRRLKVWATLGNEVYPSLSK